MDDMAAACWEAIDTALPQEKTILVGCSVGSSIIPFMYHQRKAQTAALVFSGTGYNPGKEFTKRRIDAYTKNGIDYRWDYTFEDLSPAFRATPLAHWFADLFTERNASADLATIIHQFHALARPEPAGHFETIECPATILTGSEDGAHQSAFALKDKIPNCELRVLPGAGHACQIEQPWLFDRFMIDFLTRHGLFPERRRA
jgi:pimeloyl-ACP methyl ester carboxylesterase